MIVTLLSPPAVAGRRVGLHILGMALCMVVGAALSFTRGQDINPDQSNYHYYSAYAYVTDRLDLDVAPAQVMHSYFSPIPYLPFYFMVRHWPPPLVGMGLGALHGLNLWLVFVIAWIVTRKLPLAARPVMLLAAAAISLASPMAISEFGTTIIDILVSVPILAGVALLLVQEPTTPWTRRALGIGLAGALVGAATSLKLTSASCAVGLAAACLVGWQDWRQRITAILTTALGGLVGFAAAGGSWYWLMWRTFANPVFPYFNTIFRSPDYQSSTPLYDSHYLPDGVLQALSYPFLWTRLQASTTETPFRDIRYAVLIVLAALALGMRLVLRDRARGTMTPAGRRLIVFIVVAFALWLIEWSIQRYLVPVELLLGPAFVVLLQWSGVFEVVRGRALAACAALLAIACIATVHPASWGHLGWRKTWFEVNVPAPGGGDPVYVLAGNGLSYIVPALPPGSAAIDLIPWEDIPSWGNTVFLRRIHHLLSDAPPRPVWAVAWSPLTEDFYRQIAQYGLKQEGACQTTRGRPVPLTWCPLVRTAPQSPSP